MTLDQLIAALQSSPLNQQGKAGDTDIKLVFLRGVYSIRRIGVITSPADGKVALALVADD